MHSGYDLISFDPMMTITIWTITNNYCRYDRQRRNLESPLSELSAKTSTTIETERARSGTGVLTSPKPHHSPRLKHVLGKKIYLNISTKNILFRAEKTEEKMAE